MDILIITDSGCEEACVLEIGRHMKAKPTVAPNVVRIKGSLEDAITLGYRLQTARRVLLELCDADSIDGLESKAPDKEAIALIPEDGTFKIECDVLALTTEELEAEARIMSQELIEAAADWATRHIEAKVKLSRPDAIIYAIQTPERLHIGLDIVGKALAKREWRIMLSRRSLKGTVAAATVIYSGAKAGELILDPFADDGSIVIEAALLLSKTSPRLFDRDLGFERLMKRDWQQWRKEGREEITKIMAFASSMTELKAIRMNSKLAGVDKELHTTKVTVDWVDAKIEERSVDRIITAPMPSGKSVAPQQVAKLNDQLFYQAEYVLKRGKAVTCITEKPDELLPAAEKYKFKESERRKVLMGKRLMTVITFKRGG